MILLDEKREYEVRSRRRDEAHELAHLAGRGAGRPGREVEGAAGLFADALVPALQKVRRAQGRLEQRIALLRHVEALRLYAAEHDGKLPAKLADVSVPLPRRPVHRQAVPLRRSTATRPTSAAARPRGRRRTPPSTSTTKFTVRK